MCCNEIFILLYGMQHRLRCLNGVHVACLSIQFVVGVQQDVTDLKTYLEEKSRGLGRRCHQLQPHVVVLAEDGDLTSRCVAYACVHSPVFYEAASVLEAVDAAFKSMFVLGLKYPAPPAHSSWVFVQKAVYGLSHMQLRQSPVKSARTRDWYESEHSVKT